MGTKTEERRCGGCRSFVSECECDYERCETCDRHMDVCECDARSLARGMNPDWDTFDVMREARHGGYTVFDVERAIEILMDERTDAYEHRELSEYNASHMPGKV